MTFIRSIIGLGNPGKAYQKTRHNFGFLVIDFLVKRWKLKLKENKLLNAAIVVVHPFLNLKGIQPELTKYTHQPVRRNTMPVLVRRHSLVAYAPELQRRSALDDGVRSPDAIGTEDGEGGLILAKPLTYMNYSGGAVNKLIKKYKLNPEEILIIYDDFNLPFGTIRIRRSGSSGGHQGLQSIVDSLNTGKFPRLRIGCGPLPPGINPVDFVLSRFSQEEENKLGFLLRQISEVIDTIYSKGLEKAMSVYNRKNLFTPHFDKQKINY